MVIMMASSKFLESEGTPNTIRIQTKMEIITTLGALKRGVLPM